MLNFYLPQLFKKVDTEKAASAISTGNRWAMKQVESSLAAAKDDLKSSKQLFDRGQYGDAANVAAQSVIGGVFGATVGGTGAFATGALADYYNKKEEVKKFAEAGFEKIGEFQTKAGYYLNKEQRDAQNSLNRSKKLYELFGDEKYQKDIIKYEKELALQEVAGRAASDVAVELVTGGLIKGMRVKKGLKFTKAMDDINLNYVKRRPDVVSDLVSKTDNLDDVLPKVKEVKNSLIDVKTKLDQKPAGVLSKSALKKMSTFIKKYVPDEYMTPNMIKVATAKVDDAGLIRVKNALNKAGEPSRLETQPLSVGEFDDVLYATFDEITGGKMKPKISTDNMIGKLSNYKVPASVDPKYRSMIESITDKFDSSKPREATIQKIENMRQFAEYKKLSKKNKELYDRLDKTPIADLDEAQLRETFYTIKELEAQGKLLKKLKKSAKQREVRNLEAEALGVLKGGADVDFNLNQPLTGQIKAATRSLSDIELRSIPTNQVLDMFTTGARGFENPLKKVFKEAIDQADNSILDFTSYYTGKMNNLLKSYKSLNTIEAAERIMLHALKEQADTKDLLNALTRTPYFQTKGYTRKFLDDLKLTKAESSMYDVMRESFEEIHPALNAAKKAQTGEELGYIKNYFPLKFDPEKVGMKADDAIEFDTRKFYHPSTPGFVKHNRKLLSNPEALQDMAVNLNAYNIFNSYTHSSARYIYMKPALSDSMKLLTPKVKSQNPQFHKYMSDYYQTLAAPTIKTSLGTGVDYVKRNLSLYYQFFKASTLLLQPSAVVESASILGKESLAFIKHAKDANVLMTKQLLDKNKIPNDFTKIINEMPEIKAATAGEEVLQELLQDIDLKGGKTDKVLNKLQKKGGEAIQALDGWARQVAAYAYYKVGREKFGYDHQTALKFGQEYVARTQASARLKDRPIYLSGKNDVSKLFQLTYAFKSFVLARYGNLRSLPFKKNIGFAMGLMMQGVITHQIYGLNSIIKSKEIDANAADILLGELDVVPFFPIMYALIEGRDVNSSILERSLNNVAQGTRKIFRGDFGKGALQLGRGVGSFALPVPGGGQAADIIEGLMKREQTSGSNMSKIKF